MGNNGGWSFFLRAQSHSLSKGPPILLGGLPVRWAGFHNCYSSVAAAFPPFFSLPVAVFTHDLVGGGCGYVHICGEGKLVFCKTRTPGLKSHI